MPCDEPQESLPVMWRKKDVSGVAAYGLHVVRWAGWLGWEEIRHGGGPIGTNLSDDVLQKFRSFKELKQTRAFLRRVMRAVVVMAVPRRSPKIMQTLKVKGRRHSGEMTKGEMQMMNEWRKRNDEIRMG